LRQALEVASAILEDGGQRQRDTAFGRYRLTRDGKFQAASTSAKNLSPRKGGCRQRRCGAVASHRTPRSPLAKTPASHIFPHTKTASGGVSWS